MDDAKVSLVFSTNFVVVVVFHSFRPFRYIQHKSLYLYRPYEANVHWQAYTHIYESNRERTASVKRSRITYHRHRLHKQHTHKKKIGPQTHEAKKKKIEKPNKCDGVINMWNIMHMLLLFFSLFSFELLFHSFARHNLTLNCVIIAGFDYCIERDVTSPYTLKK